MKEILTNLAHQGEIVKVSNKHLKYLLHMDMDLIKHY